MTNEELSVAEVAKHMGTGHAIDLSAIHHEEQCPTMGRVEELLVLSLKKDRSHRFGKILSDDQSRRKDLCFGHGVIRGASIAPPFLFVAARQVNFPQNIDRTQTGRRIS